jgi:hypothetical protein
MIFMPSIWTLIAGVSVVAILAAFQWWLSGDAGRFARMQPSTARSFRESRPGGMIARRRPRPPSTSNLARKPPLSPRPPRPVNSDKHASTGRGQPGRRRCTTSACPLKSDQGGDRFRYLELVQWQYRWDKKPATFVLADTNAPPIREVRPRSIPAIRVFLIQAVPSVIANGSRRTPVVFLKVI